jgi:hypothetical protein
LRTVCLVTTVATRCGREFFLARVYCMFQSSLVCRCSIQGIQKQRTCTSNWNGTIDSAVCCMLQSLERKTAVFENLPDFCWVSVFTRFRFSPKVVVTSSNHRYDGPAGCQTLTRTRLYFIKDPENDVSVGTRMNILHIQQLLD